MLGCGPKRRPRLLAGGGSSPGSEMSPAVTDTKENDKVYFESYSHLGIHEAMIKDHIRTNAYRDAIFHHREFIEGKVVMDVGCGTGILSIFCAQAGAKRVYAIDASGIAIQAAKVVADNNLSDVITVFHGQVEKADIEEKVDVLISEWMGYMLLYESMLPSVLFARDKWLKPGGLILPSHAMLYMAPITNSWRFEDSVDFWNDVYGINMSALVPFAKKCAFDEPSVELICGENVLTWPLLVKYVDCSTIQVEDLRSITADYMLASMMSAPLHGFAFWFAVEFNAPCKLPSDGQSLQHNGDHAPSTSSSNGTSDTSHESRKRGRNDSIVLSTAPEDYPTHWQQTIFYLNEPVEVKQDQQIEGSVTLSQNEENSRFLNICLQVTTGGQSFAKDYVMR